MYEEIHTHIKGAIYMEILIVKGRVALGSYEESVTRITDLEEKPNTFIKKGTRIYKDELNNITTGSYRNEFKVAVRTEEEIPAARLLIKEKIQSVVVEALKIAEENKAILDAHSFESEPKRFLEA